VERDRFHKIPVSADRLGNRTMRNFLQEEA